MSEEFEYMEKPKTTETPEEVWCKIGPTGELEVFNWQFVEKMAVEYDSVGPLAPKTNAQIICKLAILIRKQTLATAAEALLKLKDQSAVSFVLFLRDVLEESDEDQA